MILKINYYYNINSDIIIKKVSKVKKVKDKFDHISYFPYNRIYNRRYDSNSGFNLKGCHQQVYLFNTDFDSDRYKNDRIYVLLHNMAKPYIREILMSNILK
jgi:hypothetical protein